MFTQIVSKTLRVPMISDFSGNGAAKARQLDVALMKVGFKLSQELLTYLSGLEPTEVIDIGQKVLTAVRQLVGDHVQHNVYFREFPDGVPDTMEFWLECIVDALFTPESALKVALQLSVGFVNLLDLPKYGTYQHSYLEMVAAHEHFIPSVKDRVKVLQLGSSLAEEELALYLQLAGSSIPLNEADRKLLAELAGICLEDPQPDSIPVRENKAIINVVRLQAGMPLLVDTVTDVLRLACALSGGDVTLQQVTKFVSFKRHMRRQLMQALNAVIESSPAKLADVNLYLEPWKRLGERMHPHEFRQMPCAQDVFAVARGEKETRSLAGKVEIAFANGDVGRAIYLLSSAPGYLIRNLDRILRWADDEQVQQLLSVVKTVISQVSGRVILSVREHLINRKDTTESRIFVNSKGKAWVAAETREPLSAFVLDQLFAIFDEELMRRLPDVEHLMVDVEALGIALPLSDKTMDSGFAVMPRGSVLPTPQEILRFFMYWKQKSLRTDYDLSALVLDEQFRSVGYVSWTRFRTNDKGAVYSGDVTHAEDGASEFIDIDLSIVKGQYIVPMVNIFSGEDFQETAECFFGFMNRTREQMGEPFEAATVQMKADLRGSGKVALPLVFIRNDDGTWCAKWLNLYLNGLPEFNRVEANRFSTALQAKSVVQRQYLTLAYLVELFTRKGAMINTYSKIEDLSGPVTYIGIQAPEGLPEGSTIFTLSNLASLIPV